MIKRGLNPNLVFVMVVLVVLLLLLGWFAWPTRYAYFGSGLFRRNRISGCIEVYTSEPQKGSTAVGWIKTPGCQGRLNVFDVPAAPGGAVQ